MATSKQNGIPSQTLIRKLAREAVFNPRTPGPMSIVADVDSLEYLTCRATEEIRMAAGLLKAPIQKGDQENYQRSLNKAIQLLLLARARAQ